MIGARLVGPAAPASLPAFLRVTFSQAFWAPALVLVFWATAAKGFNAYILYPWLDIPTHFAGGIAGVYFLDTALVNLRRILGPIHPVLRLALAFGGLATAAIVWEFLEYLSDFALGSHLNLGVSDTLSDLFFGLFGAAGGVAIRLAERRRRA